MHLQGPGRLARFALFATCAFAAIACAPNATSAPSSLAVPATLPSPGTTAALSVGPTSAAAELPSPTTGFAFDADSVLGFYEQAGFTCGGPEPSTGADGWTVRSCTMRDAAARGLGVGVVRSPDGELGDGFASVTAADGEDFVNPTDALDHLSGFLGAMLGDERASANLEWLAGSMGNPYEETTDGELRVATYLRPSDDPRTIWLEVAGPEYIDAPSP